MSEWLGINWALYLLYTPRTLECCRWRRRWWPGWRTWPPWPRCSRWWCCPCRREVDTLHSTWTLNTQHFHRTSWNCDGEVRKYSPLVCNHDGEEDWSNENDVVDWEENSREYHCVQFVIEGYWPVKFWKIYIYNIDITCEIVILSYNFPIWILLLIVLSAPRASHTGILGSESLWWISLLLTLDNKTIISTMVYKKVLSPVWLAIWMFVELCNKMSVSTDI